MSEKKAPGDAPAFPVTAGNQVYAIGMTMRDWFAGQALMAYLRNPLLTGSPSDVAHDAYQTADAMIAARAEATP